MGELTMKNVGGSKEILARGALASSYKDFPCCIGSQIGLSVGTVYPTMNMYVTMQTDFGGFTIEGDKVAASLCLYVASSWSGAAVYIPRMNVEVPFAMGTVRLKAYLTPVVDGDYIRLRLYIVGTGGSGSVSPVYAAAVAVSYE